MDYCYVANTAYLIAIWFFPKNMYLHANLFLHLCGPIPNSLILFSDKITFHELGNLCTMWIHLLPMIVHWISIYHQNDENCGMITTTEWRNWIENWTSRDFLFIFMTTLASYCVWSLTYY